jgi:hypothetical protein
MIFKIIQFFIFQYYKMVINILDDNNTNFIENACRIHYKSKKCNANLAKNIK